MEVFQREAPDVAAAFNGLIQSLIASKGIDAKTRQLIYIAMKASVGRLNSFLILNPGLQIEISAHTDGKGSRGNQVRSG